MPQLPGAVHGHMELESGPDDMPAKEGELRVAKLVAAKTAKCLAPSVRNGRRDASSLVSHCCSSYRSIRHKLGAVVLPAATAIALGGCVAAPVTDTLESAALASPEVAAQDGTTETAFANEPGTVPVPTRSPSDYSAGTELALLPETGDPVPAPSANQAIAQQVDLKAAALASETVPAPQPAAEPAAAPASANANEANTSEAVAVTADAATTAEGNANTVTDPVTPSQEVASVQPLTQQKVEQPKKPRGLFGLFMANRQAKPKKTVQPSKPAIASASALSSGGAGLPGVQRKSAIFGINGADGSTGEEGLAGEHNIQVASVGGIGRLISPTGLILQTDKVKVSCFKPELLAILKKVERRYGKKVMVTSGYRSPKRNRRAGGVSNSTHIYCKAADIQVDGISKWDLAKYLRTIEGRGGVGTYCRTRSVHIDVGSQRDWHHPCRRSGSRSKKKKA